MADVSKTVEIIFGGKDQLGGVVDSVSGKFGALDTAVTGLAQPFAAFADGVLAADAALAAMAVGGIALAITESGKFGDSFGEINTLAKTTGEATTKFKSDILDYAQDSKKSIEDINGSVYQAISMGVDYKDSLGALNQTEKLSIAGRGDLTKTTELLIGSLNAYGAGIDQAEKFSDIFFTTVQDGKTTIPELSQALSQVTGTAAGAKVPIETLMASIAALTVSGVPTAQAITSIKAALDNIIKPSGSAAETAKSLGLNFDATALATKGFDGVLQDVYKSTGGNVETMAKLFGSTEALNAVMVLGADKSGKFAGALADMKNSAGATDKAYKEMSDNLELATQNLKNNVEVVFIEIGDKIMPAFKEDLGGLSTFFKGVKIALDQGAFDPLFSALSEAGLKVGQLLDGMGKAFPEAMKQVDFTALISELKELGGSFGALFEDFDPTDPDQLAKAIQFVVDSVESLITVTAGMVEGFKPFYDGIVNAISGFNDLDTASKEGAGNIAINAKAVVDAGLLIVGAIVTIGQSAESMKGAFEVVIGAIGFMWDSTKITIDAIVMTAISLLEKIVTAADTVSFGAFSEELDGTKQSLESWRTSWEDAFIANAQGAGDNLNKIGQGISDIGGFASDSSGKVEVLGDSIDILPDEKTTKTGITYEDALAQIQSVNTGLDTIPKDKQVTVGATADEASLATAKSKVAQWVPDEKGVLVLTDADATNLAETQKAVDDNIPKEKLIDIQAKVDIEKIKASAQTMEAALKFQAEVDVAQIEAAAKVTVANFESINETIKGTTSLLDTLFGQYTDADAFEQGQIERWINEQLANQEKALELQDKLTKAQVAYYESKSRAMDRGDALMTITGDGLQPQLEAFMWEILKAIQIKANAEATEFLLGVA